MTNKPKLVLFLFLLAINWAQAQTKQVEKVTKKGTELVIPYEKYVLSNGLTLVIHEDHSDPIAHIDVTYHVGSAREEIGKSGFAHFFEHMMFQGSDHVADEEHFKIVSESGGDLNGSTSEDRTNYYQTVPSNQLETVLWLEADRMGFLLDAVTQKKFEIQRATVKNERGQRIDNRPYGLASEYVAKTLYPYGHPYSWLTIGYVEDLDRVNVNDLKNFFLRWYGPNNAVVTIGGDVNPKEVVKLAEKYFGSIPKGPEVKPTKVPAPVLAQDRYVSYEDNIRFPMLRMTFAGAPTYHPDEAALDCLAEILGQGKNSILYKNLVITQKAVQATVSHPTSELSGEFTFVALPYPGQRLDSMEIIIRQSLAEFEERGITDDDISRFKASYEANVINGLSSVAGKVSQLAAYQTFTGNPNYITKQMKNYMGVTKADVMRVYNQYIKGKKAVILSVLPKGQNVAAAAPDNFKISKEGYKAPDYGYEGLMYVKAKDNFDRSKRPVSGKNPVVKVPPFWTDKFDNGIKVIGAKNDEIPTVTLLFTIQGGHRLSANDPSKAGVASLTASLMNEDTENYTAEQMSNELEKLGSSISIASGAESYTVSVQSLVKNLDATLKLLEERLYRPKFAQDDFERLKKQQLEGIANQNTQPTVIASKVYNRLLYGEGNIRAVPQSGTEETVKSITLEDVKTFYSKYFSPNVTNLVIVGDIEQAAVMPKLAFLNKWERKEVTIPQATVNKTIDKTKIYLVDKEKAPQSEIRVGYVALPFDATGEFYRSNIMNYALGDAFNSRINLNLREDKGYTYGAYSYFSGSKYVGPFTAVAGVRANVTDSALVEIVKELTNYRDNGITDAELAFTKSSIGQSDALDYETGFQKAGFLNQIIQYNLEADFVEKQNEILKNITREEINALAKKHLPIEKMNILVVGDKELVKPKLEKLGYELVELDKEGNTIQPQVAPTVTEPASDAPAGAAAPGSAEKKKKGKKSK